MANSGGGIIVFGLDNVGRPSKASLGPLAIIDSADIGNKISKYTGPADLEFDIRELRKRSQTLIAFVIQGVPVPLVFQRPGTYEISPGKQKTAFSVGTVYFRHGAKSEPGNSEDLRLVIERRVDIIRKSWIKDVRKVVQAPRGSRVITVQPVGGSRLSSSLVTTVRAVNDPKATPVLLTRDPKRAAGTFVHEEVSEAIFDEINNVIDANRALARGQHHFFLGQPVYFRIYAERHHVRQSDADVALLFRSAVCDFYAPSVFWILKLPDRMVAQTLAELYARSLNPQIHCLMRVAVLLGREFCEWLQERWNRKWGHHAQPPSFYWTFKDMLSKMVTVDPLVVAARITPKLLAGAQGEAVVNVKELIDRPEQAAALLSKVCIRVFEGETNLRSTARSLDYLAYGAEMRARGPNIAGAMFKAVGDQEAGNVTDSAEGHVSANGV